jgi:hypothetical protein
VRGPVRSAGFALLSSVRAPAVGIVAIVLVGAGASGCGSSRPKILDTERVERAIERSVLQKRHLKTTVSCPSGIEQKKGLAFRCIATYKGGRTPFLVKEDDAKGSVHYKGLKK